MEIATIYSIKRNKSMKRYFIAPDATLLDCLKVIDAAGSGLAVMVDDDQRLIGTVADGDIRRALVKGHELDSPIAPHVSRDCFTVLPSATRAEVIDIMLARGFTQVPIVDATNRVLGLHLLNHLIGSEARPNWAVIMAGGKGTRLGDLTKDIPKPMIQVAGRPILERLVFHLVGCGIRRVYLAVNYLSHVIEDHFGDGARFGCQIEYLREDEPLGSGGALSLLPESPIDSLLLMNGDLVVEPNFGRILEYNDSNKFFATMGVAPYSHQVPFGCVEGTNGRLAGLQEKPIIHKSINAGIYAFSPEAVASIPENTFFPITKLFTDALDRDLPCGVFNIDRDWIDVGMPEQLKEARGEFTPSYPFKDSGDRAGLRVA